MNTNACTSIVIVTLSHVCTRYNHMYNSRAELSLQCCTIFTLVLLLIWCCCNSNNNDSEERERAMPFSSSHILLFLMNFLPFSVRMTEKTERSEMNSLKRRFLFRSEIHNFYSLSLSHSFSPFSVTFSTTHCPLRISHSLSVPVLFCLFEHFFSLSQSLSPVSASSFSIHCLTTSSIPRLVGHYLNFFLLRINFARVILFSISLPMSKIK